MLARRGTGIMSMDRTISIVLAVAFIAYALYLGPPNLILIAVGYMVLPMAAIWFGDELGSQSGLWLVDRSSPGIIVKILGWILLCLAPVAVHTFKMQSRKEGKEGKKMKMDREEGEDNSDFYSSSLPSSPFPIFP